MRNKSRSMLASLFISIALIVGICPSLALAETPPGQLGVATIAATELVVADDAQQDVSQDPADSDFSDREEGSESSGTDGPATISLEGAAITLSQTSYTYDGMEKAPSVESVIAGETAVPIAGYTVEYVSNVNAGTATVTVTGINGYEGSASVTFSILPANASGFSVDAIPAQTYDGSAKTPALGVTFKNKALKVGADYTVKYANNTAAGTATATIAGTGNFTGTKAVSFKIDKAPILKKHIASIADKTYTGSAITPKATVKFGGKTLKLGRDYTAKYTSNVNAGKASVAITGKGNFTGTQVAAFKINRASMAKASVASIASRTYTGSAITPKATVKFGGKTLKLGRDYTVKYSSNVNAGKASVAITGKGNFTGKRTKSFAIKEASINRAAAARIASQTYTGNSVEPKPYLKFNGHSLKLGRDYTLGYDSNWSAGRATVYVYGKGNFAGAKTLGFTILRASIAKASVSSIGDYDYTGGAIEPSPAVIYRGETLVRDRDYVLSYSDNVNGGTALVYVKGINNFSGTKTVHFDINEPEPEPEPDDSGDIVYITRTGEKYHGGWCSYLRYSKYPISRSEAIARGYEACKVCRP